MLKQVKLKKFVNKATRASSLKQSPKLHIRFSSLLAPSSVPKFSLLNKLAKNGNSHTNSSTNKIHVKQSYVLMTWMNYIKSSETPTTSLPAIFTYPAKTKTFTQLKAPMAHKTFSQQQFKFKFFFMSASFNVLGGQYESYKLASINEALYFLHDFKSNNSIAGSNLFILKRLSISVYSNDNSFFNFHTFCH